MPTPVDITKPFTCLEPLELACTIHRHCSSAEHQQAIQACHHHKAHRLNDDRLSELVNTRKERTAELGNAILGPGLHSLIRMYTNTLYKYTDNFIY